MKIQGMKDIRTQKGTESTKMGMYTRPKLKTYREGISATSGRTPTGKAVSMDKRGKGTC